MARITVEDCVRKVSNRFDLVLVAASRSRQISSGQGLPMQVERDGDRDPVIALREIADGKITADEMNEKIISDFSRHIAGGTDDSSSESSEQVDMSEEDMLKRLMALESEQEDLPQGSLGSTRADFDQEKLSEDSQEEIKEEITEYQDDEIGEAAIESFKPSEDEDQEIMEEIEIDDEVIGEAITDEDVADLSEELGQTIDESGGLEDKD